MQSIPYENLDIHLGREIRIDIDSLVSKLVDGRRGGYCYEHNLLFATVLENLGFSVTRLLGRVRLGDPVNPRPATHMVLFVGGTAPGSHAERVVVDVGFGSATPLGPVPLDGAATYGAWTWSTARLTAPEGEEVWAMRVNDVLLYTFSEEPRHPIDYVTPNHFSSTHPMSVFVTAPTVQRSEDRRQLTLHGTDLTERRPDASMTVTPVDPDDYGALLHDTFHLDLPPDDLGALVRALRA